MILFSSVLSFLISSICLAEVGVSDTKILIGSSTGLTGSASTRSLAINAGAQIYFDKVNSKGGVHGRSISLIVYDNGYEPKKTVEDLTKLLERDKVFALFQIYGTPANKAAIPLIDKANIPYLAPLSGADFLREPLNKNIFSVRAAFADEAKRIVDLLVNKKKLKKIGMVYQEDAFGFSGRTAIERELEKHGGLKLEAKTSLVRMSEETDAAIATLAKAKLDAVILWILAKPTVAFVKRAAKESTNWVFVVPASAEEPGFAEDLRDVNAELYMTNSMPFWSAQKTAIWKQYKTDVSAANKPLVLETFEGYFNAAVMTKALEKAGKDLTRDSFRKALESMDEDFGGLQIKYSSSNHQGLKEVPLLQIKDGRYISIN